MIGAKNPGGTQVTHQAQEVQILVRESSLFKHVVLREGILVDPAKVKAIINWPRLTNVIEIQSFLGMIGYYRRFVEGFFKLALPISKLL